MAAPQALTDWYAGQNANAANNGILATGGNAPDPTANVPVTNSSQPITSNVLDTGKNTNTSTDPASIIANPTGPTTPSTSSQDASTYKGLQTANTQLGDITKWNVDPNQTASGQLAGILDSGSPLMQQANTTGLQTANARGLLNSSLAAGASENAMIGAATPIATANASTYANAAQENAKAENAFKTTNAGNAFKAQENVYNQNVATANQQSSQIAQQQQNLQTQIAGMNTQLNNDIATIQTNPNMTQQAKEYSISQLQNAYKTQITMLTAVGTVPDVTSLLTPIPGTENVKSPNPNAKFAPAPAPTPAGGGKVICTYYHSIGFMADSIYDRDCAYEQMLNKTNPDLRAWYLSWAVDFVKVLQNNSKLTWIAWPFVDAWSKEMAYQMGGLKKGNILGKSIMFIGDVCCHIMKPLKHKGEVICQK